uniref:Chaperonin-like RbcX protein n=1 Tax=Lactuca sativa TaxID=4236 RepID=A0A9R1XU35_LACSA|nr:hypothetical protein LSAT_V11C100049610 [Lactuca sativa]
MESSTILPLSHFSFLSQKPHGTSIGSFPLNQWNPTSQKTRLNCQKMYVPGFGEASPEAKAAKNLHNLFTYVAVRVVNAQLESYNTEAHKELTEFMEKHSLNDGDKFCAALMRESSRHKTLGMGHLRKNETIPKCYSNHCIRYLTNYFVPFYHCFCWIHIYATPSIAMRILEVRSAYCKKDFEWENLERLAKKMADESNTRLMRDYVLETSHVETEK